MRTKTTILTMQALDWAWAYSTGAIHAIECVLFALLMLCFSLSLQCDSACLYPLEDSNPGFIAFLQVFKSGVA